MFGEDVEEEQLGQSRRVDGVMHGDEYALLRECQGACKQTLMDLC